MYQVSCELVLKLSSRVRNHVEQCRIQESLVIIRFLVTRGTRTEAIRCRKSVHLQLVATGSVQ